LVKFDLPSAKDRAIAVLVAMMTFKMRVARSAVFLIDVSHRIFSYTRGA
jgi:hypothetical protein